MNSVVDPHHVNADPHTDSTYHSDANPDADPDNDFYLMRIQMPFHPNANPDPDRNLNPKKVLKWAHIPYILACHL
jgi:hypothetical protein